MKNNIILTLIILFTVQIINAQNVEFDKNTFKHDKNGLKEAQKAIKEGDIYFNNEEYYLALKSYKKAYNFNSNNAKLNFKIGRTLLAEEPYNALTYMVKAHQLYNSVDPKIFYYLGLAYQNNGKFDEAINNYNNYRPLILPTDKGEFEEIRKRLEECKTGNELVKNPARAFVTNVKELNTQYMEHSPVISADESVMLFTSTRAGSVGGIMDPRRQDYDEDIYISTKEKGKWSAPVNIGDPINTKSFDATVGLSADGQSLLVFRDGSLHISKLRGNKWNKPESISKEINAYYVTSASFANNDQMLYFVSDRPNGIGGTDIWYSIKDKKGKWQMPVNLGAQVNTPYDEESPFMHPDGRTLYFSSKGHNTMGGYDIFKTVKQDDGTWSKPENLGHPINTPYDDLAFVLSASGRNGYLSSRREGGEGRHDIYMVTFLGPEKPMILSNEDNLLASFNQSITDNAMEKTVELKTIRLTVVKGVIFDAITSKPIEAEIEVVDNEKNEVVFCSISNSATGRFLVSLPSGKNYGLAVKADGYLFHSENFNIPGATAYQEIEKEIRLNNIKKDVKIVLRNVFFDTGLAILKTESYPELNRLAGVLKDVPTLRIEISGHTDNTGSATTNNTLSKNRAKAVVDYLIAQQIDSGRLLFEGYGPTQPIADNKTADGRQQNRRVEFKVLSE